MSIKFININTGVTKVITLASDDYFSPEWISIVAREANAIDGWRFADDHDDEWEEVEGGDKSRHLFL
jgi:hypothetical protein